MPKAAEILALRRLDTEAFQARERFMPGQYRAKLFSGESGLTGHLTYVDQSGAVVLLLLEQRDGDWYLSSMQSPRCDALGNIDLVYWPRSFSLDDNMMRAVQAAVEERESRRRPEDEEDDDDPPKTEE